MRYHCIEDVAWTKEHHGLNAAVEDAIAELQSGQLTIEVFRLLADRYASAAACLHKKGLLSYQAKENYLTILRKVTEYQQKE
uniref:Uncharacterized protein n=1 Tax=viral metagenome TaxID=1070528 RepID=A0A6M3L1F4_9ZZZZ